MKIIYTDNYEQMSLLAANMIAAQVILKPDAVLGLATGSTPIGTYKALVEKFRNKELDFSNVRSVNLDEYYNLSADNDQSYAYFMTHNLFDHINIKKENTHVPNGLAKDPEDECRRYDRLMEELGGTDLQLLGIGHNGHIGFNEPSDAFACGTHHVTLYQKTVEANARFFASIDEVPKTALTMGIKNIMSARRILLVASGKDKAQILYEDVTGKIRPQVPASVLRLHPDVTIIADKEALSELLEKNPELVDRVSGGEVNS